MLATDLLNAVLRIKDTRVTAVKIGLGNVEAAVEPTTSRPFCSGCFAACERVYDRRAGRWWRAMDLAGTKLMLTYDLRRVDCPTCGVRTELVPWAEHDAGFTYDFEMRAAYLAQKCDKTTVAALMRIAWVTVGSIIERVVARLAKPDRLASVRRIGIDEISYRKHHSYLTVVIDLDTAEVLWMAPGKNTETLLKFFERLGPERSALLELVAIDMSAAYEKAVRAAAPKATLVFDRFHVQRLVHDALDKVRREEVRAHGVRTDEGQALKRTRFALQKNPWNLTLEEQDKLSTLQRVNQRMYRAYLLKEAFCDLLDRRQVHVVEKRLAAWIAWARRSRLAPFVKAAKTVATHLDGILAYIRTGASNGRTEGLNGKIRTITRRSYGFHRPESLMALIWLCCGQLPVHPAFTHGSASTHA